MIRGRFEKLAIALVRSSVRNVPKSLAIFSCLLYRKTRRLRAVSPVLQI